MIVFHMINSQQAHDGPLQEHKGNDQTQGNVSAVGTAGGCMARTMIMPRVTPAIAPPAA